MGIIFNIYNEVSHRGKLARAQPGTQVLYENCATINGKGTSRWCSRICRLVSASVGPANLCTQFCMSSFLHNLQSALKKGQISGEILYNLCILCILNNVWNPPGHDLPKRRVSAILSSFVRSKMNQ